MPEPRAVLEKLPLAELKALADDAGVEVADCRSVACLPGGAAHLRVLRAELLRVPKVGCCADAGFCVRGANVR